MENPEEPLKERNLGDPASSDDSRVASDFQAPAMASASFGVACGRRLTCVFGLGRHVLARGGCCTRCCTSWCHEGNPRTGKALPAFGHVTEPRSRLDDGSCPDVEI